MAVNKRQSARCNGNYLTLQTAGVFPRHSTSDHSGARTMTWLYHWHYAYVLDTYDDEDIEDDSGRRQNKRYLQHIMPSGRTQTFLHRATSTALVLLLAATIALASSGDRAQEYQDCVASCNTDTCLKQPWQALPWAFRLTRWTCLDNCRYACMHTITDAAIDAGTRIHQYHGKWPFWRFAGMQEPASVVFSLLNLLFHARGYMQLQRRIPDAFPMKRYYLMFALVSANAWIWSSVFHTRGVYGPAQPGVTGTHSLFQDLPITEKLDYFSAALAILFALFYTVVRLYHLYPLSLTASRTQVIATIRTAWATLCCVAFLGHVSYLTLLPRFDYTYNIVFNLVVGLTHNLLWLVYSLPSSLSLVRRFPARTKSYRPKYASKAAIFVFMTTAATALELFDFPPWSRVIDAHALWHLSTVPIIPFWYQFLIQDSLDQGWRGPKQE